MNEEERQIWIKEQIEKAKRDAMMDGYVELDDADISLVVIGAFNTPHCIKHGAMNKVSKEGYWRCVTTYSVRKEMRGKSPIEIVNENACRAGCKEKYYEDK